MNALTNTSNQHGSSAASCEIRQMVLDSFYETTAIDPIHGYQLLCARYLPTNVGIYVIDGDFGRSQFKLAMQEARAAGLDDTRVYAYGRTGSYSGQAICFTKFDELCVAP